MTRRKRILAASAALLPVAIGASLLVPEVYWRVVGVVKSTGRSRNMLLQKFLVLGTLVALSGCGSSGREDFDSKGLERSFAPRTKAIFAGVTKVEVFRTNGEDKAPAKAGEQRIGGFLVTAQGKDQGKDFADRLATVLADERTYTNGYVKCYWPGVAFRVWKDQEASDVLICFKCDNFYSGPPTPWAQETASFRGSRVRPQLVRLAKEAIPDDPEIQALKE